MRRVAALSLALLGFCAPAAAESIGNVQLKGSHIAAIRSGGVDVPHTDLRPGTSNGQVLDHPWATTIRSADGRNLESYFTRNGTTTHWEIDFGTDWTPGSGPAADFFVFEIGGNDSIRVRPRFLDGSYGAPTDVDGWSQTSVIVDGGPNAGQRVYGLGFRFEDLKRANGSPVTSSNRIRGIRVESSNVDGASFLVRDPGYQSTADGDGSFSFRPSVVRAASPVELSFDGPWASETDDAPNPFLDYRLVVTFRGPGGRVITVPGFFDGDGNKGDSGNQWRVRFLPPVAGAWTAVVNMRSGTNIAVNLNLNTGSQVASMHARTIPFQVGPVRSEAEGFYRVGTLRDTGKHHRRFDHGGYYVKAGTNGPENFLGLRCLDDTTKSGGEGLLHSFEPHIGDWNPGDPLLSPGNTTDDGKGVIGALNYLEEAGVNSLFLLVMNLGGDGQDTYPFVGPRRRSFEKRHYDTSKLRQWNIIFEHAQRRGISLSLVMNETEVDNELWLDNGQLGIERKLFYREMVARFGHHPAIRWNLCEETDFSAQQISDFAEYISAHDGDEHAVAFHNHPNDLALFQTLAGDPNIDAASLQYSPDNADSHVELVRGYSAQAGKKWIVDADEMGPWQSGLTDTNAVDIRKRVLYDALFSGGGIEFYFGYHDLPLGGDLSIEDFRTRAEMWTYTKHAREFIEDNLPFWDMDPDDSLVRNESGNYGGAEVYALEGESYAIYYPRASSTGQIDLRGHQGTFKRQWFNPRNGTLHTGFLPLNGNGWRDIGSPPSHSSDDWVAIVRRQAPLETNIAAGSVSQGDTQTLGFRAGPSFAGRSYLLISSLSGTSSPFQLGGLTVPVSFDRWSRYCLGDSQGTVFENRLGTLDAEGSATIRIKLDPAYVSGLVGQTMTHCVVLTGPYDYTSNVITLEVQQ